MAPMVRSARGTTEPMADSSQQLWPVMSERAPSTQNLKKGYGFRVLEEKREGTLQSGSELQAAQHDACVMFLSPPGQPGVRVALEASAPCCTLAHVSLWREEAEGGGKRGWGGNWTVPAVKRSSCDCVSNTKEPKEVLIPT